MGLLHFFVFTFTLGGFDSDFFVILLEGSQIFSGFGEFSFFHTFSDVPVNESSLGVHKIELMIDSGENFSDGSRVGDHANSSHDLSQISSGNDGGRLVIDTALETGGAPVDKLDGSLSLDGGDGSVDILGDDITSVHHTTGHIFTVTRITLSHHGGGLEGGVGDFSNGQLLVISLLGGDDGSIRGKHKMNSGVGHQVGLEFSNIDVEGTIESQRGGQRGDNLRDQSVQVGVSGSFDVQRSSGNIVDGFVIQHNSDISMFQQRVSGQHGVVGLDDSVGDLGRGVDGETQLGFLTVINRQSFQKERSQTGSGSTTDGVENQETLQTGTVISQLSDSVQAKIDDFFTNGVVTSGEVVGGIFLSGDQLFGMEQLSVGSGSNFIDDSRFQIEEDGSGNVLSGTSFREKGVESIITTTDGLVRGHLTIRLDTVLQTEEFPAGVTDLDTSLSDVD
mmetsp:Transcript_60546/g.69081  ORF Transcript_60546/g.69081 Transcript_60546/m.69081 type:complete len:448 (-) Transcript_60546:113-1456(-)